MNGNINLVEILKDCPVGTKLYTPIYGDVVLDGVNENSVAPIRVKVSDEWLFGCFLKDGRCFAGHGECLLFPSKDNRDWGAFKQRKKLPTTWDGFADMYTNIFRSSRKCYLPQECHPMVEALCQLVLLRDCYNDGWKPNWKDACQDKYCIFYYDDKMTCWTNYVAQTVLAFRTEELRDEFLENFRDLIEAAKPLL